MPELTAGTLAAWGAGRVIGDPSARAAGVAADSRAELLGLAFAAVRGEHVDGHSFVADALERGAVFAIVERADVLPDGKTGIVVDDTVRALGAMAAAARAELRARVVAITGSTGKTLTKDLVAAAMHGALRVHAAPASFNTDVTVPGVVLGCPDDADVLVTELGARRPGEIDRLSSIVRPQTGVITGIGTTHLELFGSRDAIARTKSELLGWLPADGVGIVPSDDDYLATFSSSTAARLVTVGPGGSVDYNAERITADGRTHGTVTIDGKTAHVVLPVPGRALMRDAALAIAVAREHGVDPEDAAQGIRDARLSSSRMQIVRIGGWTVIDDAYNANPTSVPATLRSAKELAGGRPVWAVLGRMAELGAAAADEHRRVGRLVAALRYDGLIVAGNGVEEIVRGAGGAAAFVGTIAEAADAVRDLVPDGAVVVVKASRSVGLDRLVDEFGATRDRVS